MPKGAFGHRGGRGAIAVADMEARLAAGWTVEQLWARTLRAEAGDGYVYDMAPAHTSEDLARALRDIKIIGFGDDPGEDTPDWAYSPTGTPSLDHITEEHSNA